jgi:peptide subunit release factor 1 (eRF1)
MLTAVRYQMSKPRLLHLLEELRNASNQTASVCLPPGSPRINTEGLMETVLDIKQIPEDISRFITDSPTGAMLFWGLNHRYLVVPPFPLSEERASESCEIEPLYTLLHRDYLIGLILVRLGAYGIGVVRGDKILTSKVGTGLVHARHRQGGSSSHRFERHREKQMETFFTRVCTHTQEQLEPFAGQLDFVIYGGTRETILDFRKQCHFLHEFDKRTLNRLLNIREPKQSGLNEAVQEAWSSHVIQWDAK